MSFRELNNRIHPKSHIGELRGLLLEKYSPLRANGDGLQSVYLAEVGRTFAAALFRLFGGEANKVADVAKEVDRAEQLSPSREPDLERWEDRVEVDIRKAPRSPTPSAKAIAQAPLRRCAESFLRCLPQAAAKRNRIANCGAQADEGYSGDHQGVGLFLRRTFGDS
ncbi:MAG TPA: hypothetical protein VK629_11350, partial [Steroidobacteraceae bacterium]|nr:hypothetical protein [Steroidobacteraceae bacterium]